MFHTKKFAAALVAAGAACALSAPIVSADTCPAGLPAGSTCANSTVTVSASDPATLALTIGAAPNLGTFVAGTAATYTATTTASVTSTGGNASLTVADLSGLGTAGKLLNPVSPGFSLANPLQVGATSTAAGTTGSSPLAISATPLVILSYSAPITSDAVTINMAQAINANEALRTGTYSKTLTFTLSTTAP